MCERKSESDGQHTKIVVNFVLLPLSVQPVHCFTNHLLIITFFKNIIFNFQLWSTEYKQIIQTLSLHQSQVYNLHFAPSVLSLILVSVGDQIGWWDINYIKQKAEVTINRNRRYYKHLFILIKKNTLFYNLKRFFKLHKPYNCFTNA